MTTQYTSLSREEWIERYAARLVERSGVAEDFALDAAKIGAEYYASSERAAGNALSWDCPEDEADEEMSNWTDDE